MSGVHAFSDRVLSPGPGPGAGPDPDLVLVLIWSWSSCRLEDKPHSSRRKASFSNQVVVVDATETHMLCWPTQNRLRVAVWMNESVVVYF